MPLPPSGPDKQSSWPHQLLLEEARTANAVVDEDVGHQDHRLPMIAGEIVALLADHLFQELNCAFAVRLPELLIRLSRLHDLVKPVERWVRKKIESAALQKGQNAEVERRITAQFADSALNNRQQTL